MHLDLHAIHCECAASPGKPPNAVQLSLIVGQVRATRPAWGIGGHWGEADFEGRAPSTCGASSVRLRPIGSLQTQVDAALLPKWGRIPGSPITVQATDWVAIKLPVGTVIHVGEVGSQGGAWISAKSQLIIKAMLSSFGAQGKACCRDSWGV
jgi:hypothetical protein